ncbi:MAG: peroxidase, partial [Polyangiaceae bacterium]
FIIDDQKKIRATITYPASTGRNFAEILRVIDSLQLTDQHKLATPADWTPGADCVVSPALDTEEARRRFGEVTVLRPYLRMAKAPEK